MKNITINIFILVLLTTIISCQKETPTLWSDADRLNFVQTGYTQENIEADTIINYTFVFEPEEVKEHTIWVEIKTMGGIYNYPRPVRIKQTPSLSNDAVAGTHYMSFDNAEVKKQFIIPAAENTAKLPITVLRNELGIKEFHLRIEFEENECFKLGYPNYSHKTIIISNSLSKPTNWDETIEYYAFGSYSQEKHQFMFDITGANIDYKYIQNILDTSDYAYMEYLQGWYTKKLEEDNQRRENEGLPKHDFSFFK